LPNQYDSHNNTWNANQCLFPPSPRTVVDAAADPSELDNKETKADKHAATNHQQATERILSKPPRDLEALNAIFQGLIAIAGIIAVGVYAGEWYEMHTGGTQTAQLIEAARANSGAALSFAISAIGMQDKMEEALTDANTHFRDEQRPIIWVTNNLGSPKLTQSGQISWSWEYTNYGKTPSGNVYISEEIKIGDGPYTAARGQRSPAKGPPITPGKIDFASIASVEAVSREDFARLLGTDRAIGIRIRIDYADVYGTPHHTGICVSHLASGATVYCKEGNYIK
jgi:hypothetical protein